MARRAKKKKKRGTRRSGAEGSVAAEAPSTPAPDESVVGDADAPAAAGDATAGADGAVALDLDDDLADLEGDLIALVAEASAVGEEADAPDDLADPLGQDEPDVETLPQPKQTPELEARDAAYGTAEGAVTLAAADAADEVEGIIDLGETSSPEDRARLLAEALAHAEMQEARYRVPIENRTASRVKGTLALGIFAIAGFLAVAPPAIVRPQPPASINDLDRRHGVVMALLLQAEQVEAFRAANDDLPRSLDELPVQLAGVRYVRSTNRLYQLIGYTPTGAAVVYDSSNPSAEFDGAQPMWRDAEGES